MKMRSSNENSKMKMGASSEESEMKMGFACEDSHVSTMTIRGFPEKCECGRNTLMYTSKSKSNPGRPFFRCSTLRNDHLFKWVEEAIYEEVQDSLPKIECFESEIGKAKVEIDGMKTAHLELMQEVMKVKNELKRLNLVMKVGFGSLCVIMCVCVVWMMLRTSDGLYISSD